MFMKKRWITIAVIVGLLMLAAFRYSLVEQEDVLPDKVRTGALTGTRAYAEEIPNSSGAAPARPQNNGWIVSPIVSTPTPAPTVTPTASPEVTPTVVPTATPEITPTVTPTATPESAPANSSAIASEYTAAPASPTDTLTVPLETPAPSATPEPRLKKGDSGAEVKKVQQKLRDLGFLGGKADGKFGAQTEKAVIAFKEHFYEMEQERLAAEREEAERLAREEAERALAEAQNDETVGENTASEPTDDALTGAEIVPSAAPESGASAPAQTEDTALSEDGGILSGDSTSENTAKAEQEEEHKSDETEEAETAPEELPVVKPVFDGNIDEETYHLLAEDGFDVYQSTLRQGAQGVEVRRLQNKLKSLGYLKSNADGIYGAKTVQAVRAFQQRHSLSQDGVAGEKTQRKLYSDKALKAAPPAPPAPNVPYSGPYALLVSTKNQRVYAYAWSNQDNAYTKLVRTMVCSTGLADTPTPKGTYSAAGRVTDWGYFDKFDVWAQYWFRIQGPYLFHSVLFKERDESTLIAGSLYKLGTPASHGCVRLKVEDAKWIYENCRAGTSVTVQ